MSDRNALPAAASGTDHKGLKAVVIILGVLLIVGFMGLIGGVVYQISAKNSEKDVKTPASLATKGVSGDILLSLPPGAEILQIDLDGTRAAVLVQNPGHPEAREILIVDLVSGRVVARLRAKED